MTSFKKTFALVAITALISIGGTRYILEETPQVDVRQSIQTTKNLKQKEQSIDKSYELTLKKQEKKNDSLEGLVKSYKTMLANADKKASEQEQKVTELATTVLTKPDSVKSKVSDCDSLSKEVSTLLEQEREKDTLCNETIGELTSQLGEKDSMINNCEEEFSNTRMLLDTALQQQQNLTNQLTALNKHMRHKVVQNKLLSVGLMVLTGVTATLVIEQKL